MRLELRSAKIVCAVVIAIGTILLTDLTSADTSKLQKARESISNSIPRKVSVGDPRYPSGESTFRIDKIVAAPDRYVIWAGDGAVSAEIEYGGLENLTLRPSAVRDGVMQVVVRCKRGVRCAQFQAYALNEEPIWVEETFLETWNAAAAPLAKLLVIPWKCYLIEKGKRPDDAACHSN